MSDWTDAASCASFGPEMADEIFFPKPGGTRTATPLMRRICGRCPVASGCLIDALEVEARTRFGHGSRGGLTADERRQLLAQRLA